MDKEELEKRLKELNDEQKKELASFLNRGEGHSVAPIEHFTDMGIPLEFLESMVDRTWSNFVQIPKGITKIAHDCVTERPIGFVDGEKYDEHGHVNKGWKFLLTPKEQEKGYLETDGYYGITKSRTQQLWLEETEEDEFDESNWEVYAKAHELHPKASYWSHRWSREEYNYDKGLTVVEYKLPVCPTRQNWGDREAIEQTIKEGNGHFLIKYDGTKRADYICANKVAWHHKQASEKPLTKKAAMDLVREKFKESPDINSVIGGGKSIRFREGGKKRPMKDIAQDYWQESIDDITWHQNSIERETERCPDIIRFIKNTDDVPLGWVHEQLEPLGYTDVMWNSNFMTPWVDGIASSRVINAIKNTLGIEKTSMSMGRGSGARENGGYVLDYLKENKILMEVK